MHVRRKKGEASKRKAKKEKKRGCGSHDLLRDFKKKERRKVSASLYSPTEKRTKH